MTRRAAMPRPFTVEDRTDRLIRRRHRWPADVPMDRGMMAWAFASLAVAVRDLRRAVVAGIVEGWRR